MKSIHKVTKGIYLLIGIFILAGCATGGNHTIPAPQKAKNIIFMVPDGQGLSDVTAARIFKNGLSGDPLYQETLKNIGYQRTYSANSTITDSAAAASAWAMGKKFNNGEISCHGGENGKCVDQTPSILELARAKGKSGGLVVTSQISHATPAAFASHVFSRKCGAEIARQYIEVTGVDVILGGGLYKTNDSCSVYPESFTPSDKRQYIVELAKADNYTFVRDRAGLMNAARGNNKKILGMFEQNGAGEGKTVEMFRVDPSMTYPEDEPTLAEMTAAALEILEADNDGFFLLVEGSQIDWANHDNLIKSQIASSLGFDAAVKAVIDWIGKVPIRKDNTLLIVVADHETGGFAINGPRNRILKKGNIVEPGWTTGKHTAVDTIIYSEGPGSDHLNAALDNTDLFYVMKNVLQ